MSAKILAGAAALALATVLATAGLATAAQNWGCYSGCYPDYIYAPAASYAPHYGSYGAYDGGPWSYRGGPHPR